MCCRVVLMTVLMVSLAAEALGQRAASRDTRGGTARSTARIVSSLKKDLREARQLLVDVTDRRLREQLELVLSRAALSVEDLTEVLEGGPGEPAAKEPLSAAEFARLLKAVKDEPFDEGKLEFIETFIKGPITCDQAAEILKTLSFDQGRVKAAIALHPGVVDPQNFYQVLKAFSFDSSKKAVMDGIKKQGE